MERTQPDMPNWWSAAMPFIAAGSACIVTSGLIAAATAHDPSRHGVWTVAYLVLVGGVAQIGLGLGQAMLRSNPASPRTLHAQLAGVNLANACVIVGTLVSRTWLVDIGGILLAATLALFLRGTRGAPAAVPGMLYRALIIFVLGSIPVGLVLARL